MIQTELRKEASSTGVQSKPVLRTLGGADENNALVGQLSTSVHVPAQM